MFFHIMEHEGLDVTMKKNWPTHKMWYDDFLVSQQNLKLYRFMSLKKFKYLLSESKLFFSRASILSDEFEGGYHIPELANEFKENKYNTFVSCWTENDPRIKSSILLWELHSSEENPIVVGVSIDYFISGLFQDEKFEKYIGKINYLDPHNVDYPEKYKANSLVPFFLKRNHFKDEKEIRVVIQDMDPTGPRSFKVGKELKGISVHIDLEKIDEIIISQRAEYSFYEEVTHLIEKAGLRKAVERVPIPSNVDSKKMSEKVKCINKNNKRQLDNVENSNSFERKNINYGTLKLESDASGNYYFEENESNHNSGSSKKKSITYSVQKCQFFDRNN